MPKAIDELFRATVAPGGRPGTVGQVLDRRVAVVRQAHADGNPAVATLFRAVGVPLPDGAPTVDHVRAVIAREHGFADWAAVAPHRDRPVDPHFEAAVDAIVSGDTAALDAALTADPELAAARSPFGHQATLIHYVTANGVETSRQRQSPGNAVEVLGMLLDNGGDPDARCHAYGGGAQTTPLCLLVSSSHPAAAGVQADLVVKLCRGGANPNGPEEDGGPLWMAIRSGYPKAVDALVSCGARADNIVLAAAAGDVSGVKNGGDTGEVRIGADGPVLDPGHLREYALIYSAGLGRGEVVEFLLSGGVDQEVKEPLFNATAIQMARYHQREDIVAVLEAAKKKR